MSDYTQTTYFATKDSLPTGDGEKIALGSDVDLELAAISDAIESKLNSPASAASEGDVLTWTSGAPVWGAGQIPVGAVMPYAGATAPTGWLMCDGRSLPQVGTYADLYAVIQTYYGNDAGGANFNLPDLRFRVPVGDDDAGTATGTAARDAGVTYGSPTGASHVRDLGRYAGVSQHTLTQAEMDHKHETWTTTNGISVIPGSSTGRAYSAWDPASGPSFGTSRNSVWSGDNETADTVSAHTNIQPLQILNYIIKY